MDDSAKYRVQVTLFTNAALFQVHFGTYDEAVNFVASLGKSPDCREATVNEWVPGRGYFPVADKTSKGELLRQKCEKEGIPLLVLPVLLPEPGDFIGIPKWTAGDILRQEG